MLRIFRHYIPSSLILLVVLEALLFWFTIYLGLEVRFWGGESSKAGFEPLWLKSLIFSTVMILSMTAMGLYKNTSREGLAGILLRLGLSMLIGFIAMSLIFYLFPHLLLGRGVFAIAFTASVVGVITLRVIFFKLVGHDVLRRRVLVLGAGGRAEQFKQLRRRTDQLGFTIVGYVHVPGEKTDVMPKDKIIHLDTPLLDYVDKHRVDEIVVAVEDRRRAFPVEDLLDCKMSGIDVMDALTFFERETGKVQLETLHPSWLIFSDGFRQVGIQLIIKRCFDICASSLILAMTWPVMLLAAAAIFIESGFSGPIFYRQVRVGQNWQLFQVMKFRSMRVDAEKGGAPQWAKKNDDRVTRVGKFIRRTRIDELPQIFNVLKGDMSFIGPRPERPEFVEQLAEKIPYYAERHRVKPGITGWAQIRYPYGASERDSEEKLQYDLYYVKNYSLLLDCLILFQTAEVVLWGQGAR